MSTYVLTDECTVKVTTEELQIVSTLYDYDFLLQYKQELIDKKVQSIADIDLELARVANIIAEAIKLGIVSKRK